MDCTICGRAIKRGVMDKICGTYIKEGKKLQPICPDCQKEGENKIREKLGKKI